MSDNDKDQASPENSKNQKEPKRMPGKERATMFKMVSEHAIPGKKEMKLFEHFAEIEKHMREKGDIREDSKQIIIDRFEKIADIMKAEKMDERRDIVFDKKTYSDYMENLMDRLYKKGQSGESFHKELLELGVMHISKIGNKPGMR